MNAYKKEKPICRTCLDTTDTKFHSLNAKLVKGEQRTSLAQFLWEISKMDNVSETAKRLPQQICDSCLRKLKIAYSFVMQVQKANLSMMAALRRDMTINFGQSPNGFQECFVNCNASFAHHSKDPMAFAQPRKRKLQPEYNERQQYIIEDSVDTSTPDLEDDEGKIDFKSCKNECHKDILLALKGITDRLDTVEGNQEIITANQGILFKQIKKNDTNNVEEEEPLVKTKIMQEVSDKEKNILVKKKISREETEQKQRKLVQSPMLMRECRVFLKRMKPPSGEEKRSLCAGTTELHIRSSKNLKRRFLDKINTSNF